MADKRFIGLLKMAYAELDQGRRFSMMGPIVYTEANAHILLSEIKEVDRLLQLAYPYAYDEQARVGVQQITTKLRIMRDGLRLNDWRGVLRLVKDTSLALRLMISQPEYDSFIARGRKARRVKSYEQRVFMFKKVENALDRLAGVHRVTQSSAPGADGWEANRRIISMIIGDLVRVQRMMVNNSTMAHSSALLRDAIIRLSRINAVIGLTVSQADKDKFRSKFLSQLNAAIGVLTALHLP